MSEKLIEVWEIYERDGGGCAAYLSKKDAEKSDVFSNGWDKINKATVSVSIGDVALLKAGLPVFF